MESRRLGPVVGLGTWKTFDTDVETAHRVVDTALAAGERLFDTSPMYGGTERSLASALEGRRKDAAVATKIWADSLAEGHEQYERQLTWFGRVEIEQVHNLVLWREHLEWLDAECAEGHVERLGVTHYSSSAFGELSVALRTRRFQTVQLPYNPLQRECERELLPLAAELGIAVIVMRPFAGGALLNRHAAPQELAALGVETWAQALLKWALSDERVDVVIPATKRPERARENAAAGTAPWLDAEQRTLVERIATR